MTVRVEGAEELLVLLTTFEAPEAYSRGEQGLGHCKDNCNKKFLTWFNRSQTHIPTRAFPILREHYIWHKLLTP